MKHEVPSKAIVIGGSMAGMLAARVLADHFEQVLLIERDAYPSSPEFRDGVPQGRHLHAFLARGQRIVEELFPGITNEWTAAGAEMLDLGSDFAWRTPKGWGIRFESGVHMLAASRPLIDFVVRQRLNDIPNVSILSCMGVDSLTGENGRVSGIIARARDTFQTHEIEASLVVDASGRMSRAPQWLEQLGYDRPVETEVNAHLGYATRIYRRTSEDRGWRALFMQAAPPDQTRAGIAFPIEGDRWIVTCCGGDRDYAPTEEGPFLEFIRSLPDPQLYQLVISSEPVGPIVGYRRMENRWRHYEKMRRRPEGFIVLGDAACAFNPVYGQGMTTAALGALALRECLNPGLQGLPDRFQPKLAKVIKTPWTPRYWGGRSLQGSRRRAAHARRALHAIVRGPGDGSQHIRHPVAPGVDRGLYDGRRTAGAIPPPRTVDLANGPSRWRSARIQPPRGCTPIRASLNSLRWGGLQPASRHSCRLFAAFLRI